MYVVYPVIAKEQLLMQLMIISTFSLTRVQYVKCLFVFRVRRADTRNNRL